MDRIVETLSDLETVRGIVAVHDEVWGRSIGIIDLLRNSSRCFVLADPEGRVCGYAFVEEDQKRGFFELQDIAVLPGEQGGGGGSALMRAVMAACPQVKLIARDSNPWLIAFYERLGFVTEQVVENYYDVGQDGRRMSWSAASRFPDVEPGRDAEGQEEKAVLQGGLP